MPRFGEGPRYRVRLLTGRFPRSYSPTSPAYSPTSPACALRCRKPLFSLFVLSSIRESHVLFHTDSPTCVIPCPRALYDALASPEASWRTAEAATLAATAHAAFRPLDPTLIAQCFYPIGRRPVARSAIDLRLAYLRLALREGRPISRARLLFYPAIRVDSPTSPAVACSVRKQFELHVERRAPRYESEITALRGHRVIAAIGARVRDRHMRAAARYYASRTSFGDARVRRRTCASASRALSAFGLR